MRKIKLDNKRITIRLDSHTKLKIDELVNNLDTNYNVLIRTIINDFIITNEDRLNTLIDMKKTNNTLNADN